MVLFIIKQNSHREANLPDKSSRYLQVKVYPGAGRNEVSGFTGDYLHVKIAAPPEKGKANKELTDFLSQILDIKKSSISIIKGETGRNKLISIEGMNHADITRRLCTYPKDN